MNANCQGFGGTFSASFIKLLSTCPKEKHLSCPTSEKKILFLKAFVIFNGLTDSEQNPICFFHLIFGKGVKAALYGSRGTVCGKLWVKKRYETKFSWGFFDKFRTFVGKFPAFLSKLHSSCRATFWGKSIFSSLILIGNFFGHWRRIVTGLAELSPQVSTNCFLHVRRKNTCLVQLLRRNFCLWKLL